MPNLVNEVLMQELQGSLEGMGSCLVVTFDKFTVEQAQDIRNKFREAGVDFRVAKNRLAVKALADQGYDMAEAFSGKCGVIVAEEEGAIGAAKLVRDATEKIKNPPIVVTGGVISGEAITGPQAAMIADMPDKDTVRAQICGAILGVGRGLAVAMQAAGAGGVSRAIQARVDKDDA